VILNVAPVLVDSVKTGTEIGIGSKAHLPCIPAAHAIKH
jgi:hypothetical protein